MKLIPSSSTVFRSLPASSSLICGPVGAPRSSIAPNPRFVTTKPVRPSVCRSTPAMLRPPARDWSRQKLPALNRPPCLAQPAFARPPSRSATFSDGQMGTSGGGDGPAAGDRPRRTSASEERSGRRRPAGGRSRLDAGIPPRAGEQGGMRCTDAWHQCHPCQRN